MRLFSKGTQWERTFRLRSNHGTGRSLLAVLFWFWGGVGLAFNSGTLLGLTGSVGVGTSAYLTATSLIWIGGMLFFGIGALLSSNDFDGERPAEQQVADIRITK
jgi:hypothetical protein